MILTTKSSPRSIHYKRQDIRRAPPSQANTRTEVEYSKVLRAMQAFNPHAQPMFCRVIFHESPDYWLKSSTP
jgi:hypothetical protein